MEENPKNKHIEDLVHKFTNFKRNLQIKTNPICKSKSYIDEILRGTFFSYTHTDMIIDPTNYEKINQLIIGDSYTTVSNRYFKEMHHYKEKIDIITDSGIILQSNKIEEFIRTGYIKEMTDFRKADNFLSYSVKLSTKKEVYRRSYPKLQIILAELGGVFKSFNVICFIILYFQSRTKFYEFIKDLIFEYSSDSNDTDYLKAIVLEENSFNRENELNKSKEKDNYNDKEKDLNKNNINNNDKREKKEIPKEKTSNKNFNLTFKNDISNNNIKKLNIINDQINNVNDEEYYTNSNTNYNKETIYKNKIEKDNKKKKRLNFGNLNQNVQHRSSDGKSNFEIDKFIKNKNEEEEEVKKKENDSINDNSSHNINIKEGKLLLSQNCEKILSNTNEKKSEQFKSSEVNIISNNHFNIGVENFEKYLNRRKKYYKISFFETLILPCIPCKQKRSYKVIENIKNKTDDIIDIIRYMREIIDLKRIKKIICKENELKLLEYPYRLHILDNIDENNQNSNQSKIEINNRDIYRNFNRDLVEFNKNDNNFINEKESKELYQAISDLIINGENNTYSRKILKASSPELQNYVKFIE